jgi:hypothetical protein
MLYPWRAPLLGLLHAAQHNSPVSPPAKWLNSLPYLFVQIDAVADNLQLLSTIVIGRKYNTIWRNNA